MTVQGTEEIPFERTRQSKQTQDEKRQEKDLKTAMQGSNKSEIVGRRVCFLPRALPTMFGAVICS